MSRAIGGLLAPKHFHHWGLRAWLEIEDLSALEAALPEGMRLLSPPGAKQGETWVSLKMNDGVAWFVTLTFRDAT